MPGNQRWCRRGADRPDYAGEHTLRAANVDTGDQAGQGALPEAPPIVFEEPVLPDALPAKINSVQTAPQEMWAPVTMKIANAPSNDFEENKAWLMKKLNRWPSVEVKPYRAPWGIKEDRAWFIDWQKHIVIRKAHPGAHTARNALFVTLPIQAYNDRTADYRILVYIKSCLLWNEKDLSINWLGDTRGRDSFVDIVIEPKADIASEIPEDEAASLAKSCLRAAFPGRPVDGIIYRQVDKVKTVRGKKVRSFNIICPSPEMAATFCSTWPNNDHDNYTVFITPYARYIPVEDPFQIAVDTSQASVDYSYGKQLLTNMSEEYNRTAHRPGFFCDVDVRNDEFLIAKASDPFLAYWATQRPFANGSTFESLMSLNSNNLIPLGRRKEARRKDKIEVATHVTKQLESLSKDVKGLQLGVSTLAQYVGQLDQRVGRIEHVQQNQGRLMIEYMGLERDLIEARKKVEDRRGAHRPGMHAGGGSEGAEAGEDA